MRCKRPVTSQALAAVGGFATVILLAAPASSASATGSDSGRSVVAHYSCPAEGSTYSVPVKVAGSTPKSVAKGATVKMEGFQMSVTLPEKLVNLAVEFGGTSVSGTVTVIDLNASDAKLRTVNAAGKGIDVPTTDLVKNKPLTIKVPAKPSRVGSWTARKKGTMTFVSGDVDVTLVVPKIITVKLACTVAKPPTLSTTTVS